MADLMTLGTGIDLLAHSDGLYGLTTQPTMPSKTASLSASATVTCVAVLLAAAFVPHASIVLMCGLSVLALRSKGGALIAMALATAVGFTTYAFVDVDPNVRLVRWLLLGRACVGTLLRAPAICESKRVIVALVLFAAVSIAAALVVSPFPEISIFKVGTFTLGAAAAIVAAADPAAAAAAEKWLLALGAALIVTSVPFLFMAAGRWVNGSGFQGVASQPQAFAVMLAPLLVYLTVSPALKRSSGVVAVVACGWFMLFSSLSRTGLTAALMALTIAAAEGFVSRDRWRRIASAGPRVWVPLLAVAALVAAAPYRHTIDSGVAAFLSKGDPVQSLEEIDWRTQYQGSRGDLIQQSWRSFLSNPWLGIGFGISPWLTPADVVYDPVLGLPVSAPEEKGNIVTAMLEEVGITGTAVLAGLLWVLLSKQKHIGHNAARAALFACLFINLGEMVFFAMGGLGMLFWVVIAVSRERARVPLAATA